MTLGEKLLIVFFAFLAILVTVIAVAFRERTRGKSIAMDDIEGQLAPGAIGVVPPAAPGCRQRLWRSAEQASEPSEPHPPPSARPPTPQSWGVREPPRIGG